MKNPPQNRKEDLEFQFKKLRKLYDSNSIKEKLRILSKLANIPQLHHIGGYTYNPESFKGNIENPLGIIQIPLGIAGPLWVDGKNARGDFWIPLATTEGALVLTYDLGMHLLRSCGPIKTEVLSKVIHITPMFPIKTNEDKVVSAFVDQNRETLKTIAESNSRHTHLLEIEKNHVKNNFLLKFRYDTEDAHGLNMINHATLKACKHIEEKTGAKFYLRSHYSGVKHHSLLNEKTGYGRRVRASVIIPHKILNLLKITAEQLKDFCDRCIECGSAAGISCINVHAANAITAIYLACGQDAADISSSHVCYGKTRLINRKKDFYWECTLPNLLVGTVGGGTHLATQKECLSIMGCLGSGNSDKFAELIAATVLSGEFTTAAAVINGTYVSTHNKYGRNPTKEILPLN